TKAGRAMSSHLHAGKTLVEIGQTAGRPKGARQREVNMEFLVEFEVRVPDGVPPSDIRDRQAAEAAAAAKLAEDGHLDRVWRRLVDAGQATFLGLYRPASDTELRRILAGLPLREWMHITVTPLAPNPNDTAVTGASHVDAAP